MIYTMPIEGRGFHSTTGGFAEILIGGAIFNRVKVIHALMFYEQFKAALGTNEDGAALVDVARAANRAELKLASIERKTMAQ